VNTSDRLSLSFLYVQSEELQRALWSEGFLVDSGSACSSSALEPSHVLTRMGLLSHGNVRLKFRPENLTSVDPLAETLLRLVPQLRG
ncbi:MAG: aminotransferase, partial [Candidatus Nanopelagicaceae bacterium]